MHSLPADLAGLNDAYAYPAEPGRSWLRANMISSLDGAAWRDDRTEALGSPADQRLFAVLRGMADVVIVGAETVRVEGYGPIRPRPGWEVLRGDRSPAPPLAIVSRRLDLDLDAPVFTEAVEATGSSTILLTTETAPADLRRAAGRRAEVIVAGRDGIDFRAAIGALAERGHRRLLCEGGPAILARAATDEVLDELCLTLSPLLVAGDPSRILDGPPLAKPERLRLASLYEDEDFLFLRYMK